MLRSVPTALASLAVLASLSASAGPGAPLAAQSILVRVSDAETGQPLQGVLVAAAVPGQAPVRSVLSDAAGRARLLGIAAGTYEVRAELIGYASAARSGVDATEGAPTVLELRLASRAIELEGISVEGEERCRVRPEDGLAVAAVWDEARKALEATRLTEEMSVYTYRVRKHLRDVDTSGRVVNQEARRSTLVGQAAYESRPAEDLVANGFVQPAGDDLGGDLYFAPDAAVLLSDPFLDTHCLRLRRGDGENAGRVGLVFEPVDGRRLPDIAGTLWLDAATSRLEHLEFRYANVHEEVGLENVGGEVRFQRLPDGTWVIPRWWIRMPRLVATRDFRGQHVVRQEGYREEGGTILSVSEPGGARVLTATGATVEGVVLEEISSEPVAGARVALDGTDEAAVTGADGRFRFAELLPGSYAVALDHPTLAPYGLPAEPVGVEAVAGEVASVTLRLPSRLSLVDRACSAELDDRPDDTAALVGRVLVAGSEAPVEGAVVTLAWDDFRVDRPGTGATVISQTGRGATATTGPNGAFRACVVPARTPIRITAAVGDRVTPVDTVRVPAGEPVLVHDVIVPAPPAGVR